jgi:hypothetical protein
MPYPFLSLAETRKRALETTARRARTWPLVAGGGAPPPRPPEARDIPERRILGTFRFVGKARALASELAPTLLPSGVSRLLPR